MLLNDSDEVQRETFENFSMLQFQHFSTSKTLQNLKYVLKSKEFLIIFTKRVKVISFHQAFINLLSA